MGTLHTSTARTPSGHTKAGRVLRSWCLHAANLPVRLLRPGQALCPAQESVRGGNKGPGWKRKDSFLKNPHRTGRAGGARLGIKCPIWLWVQGQASVTGRPGRPGQAVSHQRVPSQGPKLQGGGLPRGRDLFSSISLRQLLQLLLANTQLPEPHRMGWRLFQIPTKASLSVPSALPVPNPAHTDTAPCAAAQCAAFLPPAGATAPVYPPSRPRSRLSSMPRQRKCRAHTIPDHAIGHQHPGEAPASLGALPCDPSPGCSMSSGLGTPTGAPQRSSTDWTGSQTLSNRPRETCPGHSHTLTSIASPCLIGLPRLWESWRSTCALSEGHGHLPSRLRAVRAGDSAISRTWPMSM